MDTKLTVKDIEMAIINDGRYFNLRSDIAIPNLSYGMLNHEADLVVIDRSGYMTEFEIKRSLKDLKADFRKKVYHKDERVYRFFYVLPESIMDKATEFLKSNYKKIYNLVGSTRCATLYYDKDGSIKDGGGIAYVSGGRKLFLEEQLRIARYASIRYWNLRNEII